MNLTSSIQHSGRNQSCPSEEVTYTCETNGTLLTWIVEPYFPEDNPITFTFTDPLGTSFVLSQQAPSLLIATEPTMVSTLVLKPSPDVNNTMVICRTSNGISQSVPYRKSGIGITVINVYRSCVAYIVVSLENLHITQIFDTPKNGILL